LLNERHDAAFADDGGRHDIRPRRAVHVLHALAVRRATPLSLGVLVLVFLVALGLREFAYEDRPSERQPTRRRLLVQLTAIATVAVCNALPRNRQ